MRPTLEEFGHAVTFANSAAQALEALKSSAAFDLVVTALTAFPGAPFLA